MGRALLPAGAVICHADPLNCEAELAGLGDEITPTGHFYARNHFEIPKLDASTWRLKVGGLARRPLSLTLSDLHWMRSQTQVVTLECAGNGRSMLKPPVEGEQWGLGAVSTAEWTGVPLVDVLDLAGIAPGAREVLFRGADGGSVRFERSLGLDTVRGSHALLAYAMNGEPLLYRHGFPLRLIVPGWYGVASVKWLTEIDLIDHAFAGYFQTEKYVYEWERYGRVVREPVEVARVRALITEPGPNQEVGPGNLPIRGVAWSGAAPIARVEVRIGGSSWQEARLLGKQHRYGWRRWELIAAVGRGATTIQARATDLSGGTQPERPEWNRLGYGANGVQQVQIRDR